MRCHFHQSYYSDEKVQEHSAGNGVRKQVPLHISIRTKRVAQPLRGAVSIQITNTYSLKPQLISAGIV